MSPLDTPTGAAPMATPTDAPRPPSSAGAAAKKVVQRNPLKMSAPLGAALAYMGIDRCIPLFHGSQGCTAFAMVLMVRHFREPIPFQTTAMNEATTILGGAENLEQAILNIRGRAQPRAIGVCSTGLTETKGEDFSGDLNVIRKTHPELADTALLFAATPDYVGGLEDGWAIAVRSIIEQVVEPRTGARDQGRVNILAGCHLTAGDIEELRSVVEAFGLSATILPDLSGALDGVIPDVFTPTTFGGTTIDDVRAMGSAVATFAIGRHMASAAATLEEKAGVPYQVFDHLSGLAAMDGFVDALSKLTGEQPPARLLRQRSQYCDAMLDSHFFFAKKKVLVAAEPDLLLGLTSWLNDMGATVALAVGAQASAVLDDVIADKAMVGDLADIEQAAEQGADLIIGCAHARQASEATGVPLFRVGFPIFDRLGAAHIRTIGYRGLRDLTFAVGNIFIDALPHHGVQFTDLAGGGGGH